MVEAGGSIQGIGHIRSQKLVYDPHYGAGLSTRMHHNKPPTILDRPLEMKFAAVNLPDPETPVGARGVGEFRATLTMSIGGAGDLRDALADHVCLDQPQRL